MWLVATAFVELIAYRGIAFVHVGCCVSIVAVVMERRTGLVRACGGVDKVVAIELTSFKATFRNFCRGPTPSTSRRSIQL